VWTRSLLDVLFSLHFAAFAILQEEEEEEEEEENARNTAR